MGLKDRKHAIYYIKCVIDVKEHDKFVVLCYKLKNIIIEMEE